ncbi:MAG: efflux RND transporter permease subunit [Gammaproteobacteria bacterium]
MMRWIIDASARLRLVVLGTAAVLVGVSIVQLRDMPAEALPDFTPPMVQVRTEALGLSAAEVEQLLTVPMEQEFFNGLPWSESLHSESLPGLSSVDMIFKPGTDVFRARQMVQERLTLAHALPNVSKPPLVLQPLSSTSRVLVVGLSSTTLSPIEMSVLARWKIKPRLSGVPGVANVAIFGMRERQLQVQVDPEQLNRKGVSLSQVISTTGNALWSTPLTFLEASTPGMGGFIDTANQRLGIQHISPIKSAKDLAQVAIVDTDGGRLRLGDVAQVIEGHQPLIGDAFLQGGGLNLLLVIERFPGASIVEVTRGIEHAIESMRAGLTGVQFDTTVYRPATFLETALDSLTTTLSVGFLLLALVFGAVLFDWRAAFISVVAVPLSFLAAVLVLSWIGATLNMMVLAGLVMAVAVVVDDAVADVENIMRRLRQRPREGSASPLAVALDAAAEMRGSLVYPTLVILVSVVPLLFLGGVSGSFFRPLGLAYGLAVLGAFVVALTVTPGLAVLLLARAPGNHRDSPLTGRLRDGYGGLLGRTVDRPGWVYAAAGLVTVAGIATLPLLAGQPTLPALQDRDVVVQVTGSQGRSHPAMSRITALASQELRSVPGVRNVGAHVGRAVTSDQVVGINSGELWVSLSPEADYGATTAAIQTVMEGYPGIRSEVLTYPEQRVRMVRVGAKEALVVRVFGRDLEALRATSAEIRQILSEVEGVIDPQVDLGSEEPTVEIEVNVPEAQRNGLKPGDIKRAAATLLNGIEAGSLFEEQKIFEVVVWSTPRTRNSLSSIRELLIDRPDGTLVRLGDVADVRIKPNPQAIRHAGAARFVDVLADVRGRDLGEVTSDIERRLKQVTFPQEHHAEVLGQLAQQRADRQRTWFLVGAALLMILLFVQAALGSWRLAIGFLLAIPVAVSGALVAAALMGKLTSLISLAGVLVVLGIAVRQGMVQLNHYQRLERRDGQTRDREVALAGARDRFAPIVMSTLGSILALLPLVIVGSLSGHEIVHPLAVIVLGGLVTSTLLNLLVTPGLYLRVAPASQPDPAAELLS